MSQERREKDRKREDVSLSSVNSSLTDENLEKEEHIKKMNKKMKVLKAAYTKEKEKVAILEAQLGNMAGGRTSRDGDRDRGTITPGNFVYKGQSSRSMSEDEFLAIKEKCEKDAFQSRP